MPKSSEETEHLLPKVEHLVPQLTETRVVDVADAFYQLEPHPDPSSVLEVSSVDSAALCPFTTYRGYLFGGLQRQFRRFHQLRGEKDKSRYAEGRR